SLFRSLRQRCRLALVCSGSPQQSIRFSRSSQFPRSRRFSGCRDMSSSAMNLYSSRPVRHAKLVGLFLLVGTALTGVAWANDGPSILAAIEEETVSLIERVEPSVVSIVRGNLGSERTAADQFRGFGNPGGAFGRPGFGQSPQPSDPDFIPDQFGAGVVVADE